MSNKNEVTALMNLGALSGKMLNSIGIYNRKDLEKADLVDVYLCLKSIDSNVSLNMLWAMQGAIMDLSWKEVPSEIKDQLKEKIIKRS